MTGQTITIIAGLLGFILTAFAALVGFRYGKNKTPENGFTEGDRQRVRHLLSNLGDWTSEYSGSVSQYQDQLGRLQHAVETSGNAEAPADRVLTLLEQIMNSNDQLQTRLEAAEKQLDKQTRQIESYLTEARTDALTGLANRRAFDQKMDELLNAYRKGGRSFALALIDIDHFKSVNDNHGHQIGDHVLQQLAGKLNHELRAALIVARFGGEEFAVVLDGPLRRAAEQMNQFRKDFAGQRIEVGSLALEITMSIGVSEPRDDTVVAPIIRRADEALYAAKNIGRNRVYFHDGKGVTLTGAPEVAR